LNLQQFEFTNFISRPYLVRSHLCYSVASVCRRLSGMYCGWTVRPRAKVTLESL